MPVQFCPPTAPGPAPRSNCSPHPSSVFHVSCWQVSWPEPTEHTAGWYSGSRFCTIFPSRRYIALAVNSSRASTAAISGYPWSPKLPTAHRCPLPSTLKLLARSCSDVYRIMLPLVLRYQPSNTEPSCLICKMKGVAVSPQVVSSTLDGVLVAVVSGRVPVPVTLPCGYDPFPRKVGAVPFRGRTIRGMLGFGSSPCSQLSRLHANPHDEYASAGMMVDRGRISFSYQGDWITRTLAGCRV